MSTEQTLKAIRNACRNQRNVLLKHIDDCELPLNRASIELTTEINQRASILNDFAIVLTDAIVELQRNEKTNDYTYDTQNSKER